MPVSLRNLGGLALGSLLVTALGVASCGRTSDLIIGERAEVTFPAAGATTGGGGGSVGGAAGIDASAPLTGGSAGADPMDGGGLDASIACEATPVAGPRYWYTFDDVGTTVTDQASGQDGTVVGTVQMDGSGILDLSPDNSYVDLPNGLISGLPNLTVAVWFEWAGGAAYQRIFDFGDTRVGEDPPFGSNYGGVTYLALTPAFGNQQMTYLLNRVGGTEVAWLDVEPLVTPNEPQFAAVVLQAGVRVSLFLDGQFRATSDTDIVPSDINDINVWLGRSQWDRDTPFNGSYDELRIYDVALCEDALLDMVTEGPVPNPKG